MLIHLNLIQSICQERKIYLKPDEVNDVEILPEMLFSSKILCDIIPIAPARHIVAPRQRQRGNFSFRTDVIFLFF